MTLYFANHQIIILRSRAKTGYKVGMSATFTAMPATIEPATPERTQFINGRPGTVYTGFVGTDYRIREGDRLVVMNDDNSRSDSKYEVRNVQSWQGSGLLDHYELTLVSEVSNG